MKIKELFKQKKTFVLICGALLIACLIMGILVYNDFVRVPVVSSVMNKVGIPTKVIQASDEVTQVFETGDSTKISEIFSKKIENPYENEYPEFFENQQEEKVSLGVMNDLFNYAQIEVDSYNNSQITYNIKTVDMSNFFQDVKSQVNENTTEEEFKQMIIDYAKKSKEKEFKATIDYVYENAEFYANYHTSEFINAMSGGFLDSYILIYNEYLNEIFEGVIAYE